MSTITVEQRIFDNYRCTVATLLEQYAAQGMTSKQVAEKLECGVSNVRRIARKYNISFNQPSSSPKMSYSKEFLDRTINASNLLSRAWSDRFLYSVELETA